MPIYDFQCTSCGHKLELLRKISDPSTATCPNCNQETFNKMLSAPSFQLSGSGWYATDFKDKKVSKPSSSESAESTTKSDAPAACKTGCACH
ncbi:MULTISPECIES: FmdB family zinc ribbon protein [Methylotenera]|uniref:FmdB family zinc ribbon protein n=1 Tax=Methylotenera TaxID=359407 RepID=UPI0003639976|nr:MULTISPECIES: zinc ribbon domain-containing protein [Methylotenera]